MGPSAISVSVCNFVLFEKRAEESASQVFYPCFDAVSRKSASGILPARESGTCIKDKSFRFGVGT